MLDCPLAEFILPPELVLELIFTIKFIVQLTAT